MTRRIGVVDCFPIEPLNETVILTLKEPERETKGGILLPESYRRKMQLPMGVVRAVSEDCDNFKSPLRVGDIVVFQLNPEGIQFIRVQGEEYIAVDESLIVARVHEIPDGVPMHME